MCIFCKNKTLISSSSGQNGEPGNDGKSIGIKVTQESPGVNCENGGILIEVGPDNTNDGLPDIIVYSYYICNGEDNNNSINSIVTTYLSDGVTPINGNIYPSGHLIIQYSNNTYQDVGNIQGQDGTDGIDGNNSNIWDYIWDNTDAFCLNDYIDGFQYKDNSVKFQELITWLCQIGNITSFVPTVSNFTYDVFCGQEIIIDIKDHYQGIFPIDTIIVQNTTPSNYVENGILVQISPTKWKFTSNGTCPNTSDFSFQAIDTNGTYTNIGLISLNILQFPNVIAVNDNNNVEQGESVNIDLSLNDTFTSNPVFTITSMPSKGIITPSSNNTGIFSYTATEHCYGSDIFEYSLTDISGTTDTANITIFVNNTETMTLNFNFEANWSGTPGTQLDLSFNIQIVYSGDYTDLIDNTLYTITAYDTGNSLPISGGYIAGNWTSDTITGNITIPSYSGSENISLSLNTNLSTTCGCSYSFFGVSNNIVDVTINNPSSISQIITPSRNCTAS